MYKYVILYGTALSVEYAFCIQVSRELERSEASQLFKEQVPNGTLVAWETFTTLLKAQLKLVEMGFEDGTQN